MNPMNASIISQRRIALEKWLQHALSVKALETFLREFLEIQPDMLERTGETERLNEDERIVKDFESKINANPHSRTNIIDTYEKKFFSKRRNIRDGILRVLMSTLVPLCGDDYIGSKALYFIRKLCAGDHNRDFEGAIKALMALPVPILQQMKLDEYLLKNRFSESQMQAFELLSIFSSNLDPSTISSIVNVTQVNNKESALSVFHNWATVSPVVAANNNTVIPNNIDWRVICLGDTSHDLEISFRYVNKQLELIATFKIESDFVTLIHLLTDAEKRKTWDLKLHSIEEIPTLYDELCLKMVYLQDRAFYEFHNTVRVDKSISSATIHFKSKIFSQIKAKGLLGQMTSCYKLQLVKKNEKSFSEEHSFDEVKRCNSCGNILEEEKEKTMASIHVTWKAKFCEDSKRLFLSDCLEETGILKGTLERLIKVAECRDSEAGEMSPVNTILQACERKKLRKLSNLRKLSTNDDFF
jgi:hypothetical protein